MNAPLCLNASQIAIITGHNRYQKFTDFLLELWIKYNKEDYEKILELNKNVKYEKKLKDNEMIEKYCNREIKNEIKKSLFSNDVQNINANKKNVMSKVDKLDCDDKTKKEIKKSIQNHMNTQYGIKNEDKAIKDYEKQQSIHILRTNEYKKRRITNGLFIGGRIDGYTENGNIVEIKNRMNRLFLKLVPYEKVQLQSYLYIFEKKSGYLVEKYKDQLNVIEEKYNDKFFKSIKETLINFRDFFNDFLENVDLKTILLFAEDDLKQQTFNSVKSKYNF